MNSLYTKNTTIVAGRVNTMIQSGFIRCALKYSQVNMEWDLFLCVVQ